MYEGFAVLGGTEIINNARAETYGGLLGVGLKNCGCPTLADAVGDDPYVDPKSDNAPWYDPAVPESERFAGFAGMNVEGFNRGTTVRTPQPLWPEGSVLGALRHGQREMTFTVLAAAADDCALAYGLSWLSQALRGTPALTCTTLDDLCMFSCCPPCEPGVAGCGDDQLRQMYRVGLLDAPQVMSRRQLSSGGTGCGTQTVVSGGGWVAEVQFTLVAGTPWIYRPPSIAVPFGPLEDFRVGTSAVIPYPDPCPEVAADCLRDPTCPQPAILPTYTQPLDSCYPKTLYETKAYVVQVKPDGVPGELEKVPVIRIGSGSADLRNITIRFMPNPKQLDCFQNPEIWLDDCSACAEINILYIQAGTTAVLDGRINKLTADCPGKATTNIAEGVVYGRGATAFDWPIFDCVTSYCATVDVRDSADDVQIEIGFAAREDMS